MPENFYTPSEYYPDILYVVLERIQLYIANLVYFDLPLEDAKKRFIRADIGVGEEVAIRRAIETFPSGGNTTGSQSTFPFTAYSIGDEETVEYRSHLQKSALYYVDDLEKYMAAIPCKITFPMITFYNTARDWRRFDSIIQLDSANLTRLWCPCTVFGKTNYFPIDINVEISKGEFAFAFEQHLATGKIYDVVHNFTVYYHKYVFVSPSQASGTGKQEVVPVYPVEDIVFSLKQMDSKNTIQTRISPETPQVLSSSPHESETGVDIHGTPIILNFNVGMNESTVLSNLDIVPSIQCDKIFNNESTQLLLDPRWDLLPNTEYTILINDNAKSLDGVPLENDFTLKFTTEA